MGRAELQADGLNGNSMRRLGNAKATLIDFERIFHDVHKGNELGDVIYRIGQVLDEWDGAE